MNTVTLGAWHGGPILLMQGPQTRGELPQRLTCFLPQHGELEADASGLRYQRIRLSDQGHGGGLEMTGSLSDKSKY